MASSTKENYMSIYGVTLTVLATGLSEAVRKDELPEEGGFDLSAGMFGTHVSNWLREVAAELTKDNIEESKQL